MSREEDVTYLHAHGWTVGEIGHRYGISARHVRRILDGWSPSEGVRAETGHRNREIAEKADAGMAGADLAAEYELSRARVSQILGDVYRKTAKETEEAVEMGLLVPDSICEACQSASGPVRAFPRTRTDPMNVRWLCDLCAASPQYGGKTHKAFRPAVMEDILRVKNAIGRVPSIGDMMKYGRYVRACYTRSFGTYRNACLAAKLNYDGAMAFSRRGDIRENLLVRLYRKFRPTARSVLTAEALVKHDLDPAAYVHHFGSLEEAKMAAIMFINVLDRDSDPRVQKILYGDAPCSRSTTS